MWTSTLKVFSPPILGENARVLALKLPSGEWNTTLIKASFLPNDVSLILGIPCSSHRHDDSLLWHFDKLGVYSVKSGYQFGYSVNLNASSSGLSSSESWWKFYGG